jgi:hypothetical protein
MCRSITLDRPIRVFTFLSRARSIWRLGGVAVFGEGALLGLDQGVLHLAQDVGHHGIAVEGDVGDRLHGVDPARRGRRHLGALGVVLLDLGDLLAQAPLQRRALGEVPVDRGVDALELALDDALRRLAPGRQQDFPVAGAQAFLGPHHRARHEPETPAQHPGQRRDHPVGRLPGEVERGGEQQEPGEARQGARRRNVECLREQHRRTPCSNRGSSQDQWGDARVRN